VDFEQKTLTAQAERRRIRQRNTELGTADQQKPDDEDEVVSEKEEELPSNPDDQWSVAVTISW